MNGTEPISAFEQPFDFGVNIPPSIPIVLAPISVPQYNFNAVPAVAARTVRFDVPQSTTVRAIVPNIVSAKSVYEVGYPPYTVHVTKAQYENGRLVVSIGAVLLSCFLLGVLILVIAMHYKSRSVLTKIVPVILPTLSHDMNIGGSHGGSVSYRNGEGLGITTQNTCVGDNVKWDSVNKACVCAVPYFGAMCDRESHDREYYALGTVTPPDALSFSSEPIVGATTLSFLPTGIRDVTSCTSRCTAAGDACFGVVYANNSCDMITSPPILAENSDIDFSADAKPEVYLRTQRTRPVITDRVFAYSGKRMLRYWSRSHQVIPSAKDPRGVIDIWSGQVVHVNWKPTRVVNDGSMVGVWSTRPFFMQTFDSMLSGGPGIYIDHGTSDTLDYAIPFPKDFKDVTSMYVMYRSNTAVHVNPKKYYTSPM